MKKSQLDKAKEEGRLAHLKGLFPVHCPYSRKTMALRDAWLSGWLVGVKVEAVEFVGGSKRWKFRARLLQDDKRSGFKKGKVFDPRGFYYNQSNKIILVGSVKGKHCGMLAFPVDIVAVEVESE